MEALLRKIREYLRKHHNARQLRRTIMSLAMVVVFVTTYVLILPAVTIDKDTAATDPAIVMDASAEEDIQTATEKAEETPAPETEAPETEAPEEVTQPETVELEPETNAPQAAAPHEEPKAEEKQKDSEKQNGTEKQKEAEPTEKAENQKEEPRDTEAASDAKEEENVPVAGKATYKTKDFTITVTWDKDAGLMADTALNLQELIREKRKDPTPYDYVNEEYYDGYVNGTRYALQKSIDKTVEIADVRFLQLYLTYEGQIVTPKNKVKVDIEYKKPVEKVEKTTIKAVHFDAEKEEPVVLPVKVKVKPGEDGAPDTIEKLRFETSRISFYGITYVQLNSDKADEEQNETLAEDEAPTEESSAVDETQDTDEKTVFYMEDEDTETASAEGESKEGEVSEETAENGKAKETTETEETTEDGETTGNEENTGSEESAETEGTEGTEETAEAEPITFTDLSTNVIVNVTAPADAFPEGTTMEVIPADAGEVEAAAGDLVEGQIKKVEAVDITFRNAEGEEIQPLKPIQVVLLPKTFSNKGDATVVHVDGDGKADVVEAEAEGAKVTFEAENFSVYAIVYTVDFHWEVNGKTFEFSIPGGGFVSFRQLAEALGLADQTAQNDQGETAKNTEEATKQFVEDVVSIKFSTPELLFVRKVENETTVGAIKDGLGLECEYSVDLTEEQIAQINAQTVDAGDWALISKKPFLTEESLKVTMKNGEVFTIQVTDGQIIKHYISASGDTYEIFVTYDDSAQIPDDAELRVREITEKDEAYSDLQKNVTTQLAEDAGLIPVHPTLFDISIWADGKEIEPAEGSEVKVDIKLVRSVVNGVFSGEDSLVLLNDAPLSESDVEIKQNMQVIHQKDDGAVEVMDTKDTITDDEVVSEFMVESFSNYLVFLDQDVEEITVGRGDTITLRPYSQWVWNQQNVVDGQAVYWRTPNPNGHMTVETKSYTDGQLNQTYSYYQLTATTNPGVFYIETTAGKRIKVTVKGETVSDVPGTVEGLDNIKVNLFNYDLDKSLDVRNNVASYIDSNNGRYTSMEYGNNGQKIVYYQQGPYANDGINAGSALKFLGWGASNGSNRINNYVATSPTTNIVQNTLAEGTDGKLYPRLNGNGNTNLQYLFSSGNGDVEAHMGVTGLFRQDTDGYYYFNSNTNYAIYNNDNTFTLYEHTYTQATTRNNTSGHDENSKPIGFFPFHAYDSNNNLSPNHDTALDHHFGISMEVTFSLPEGKVLKKADGSTEPIKFEFSGDDDMWVFVDDNLTLDLGGIHQPITGSIDFTNDDRFEAGKEYTLRIFYLERGGCDSNCSIRFNMPLTVGKGDVRIAKKRNKPGETTDTFLGGAVFGIWTNENCTGEPLKTMTSAAETGLAVVEDLPVNEPGQVYYMKEITPPTGYIKNNTIYTVTASAQKGADGKYTFTIRDKDDPVTALDTITQQPYSNAVVIKNEPAEPIDLTVQKQWQNADGSPAAAPDISAKFKVKRWRTYDKAVGSTRTAYKVTLRNASNNNELSSRWAYAGDQLTIHYQHSRDNNNWQCQCNAANGVANVLTLPTHSSQTSFDVTYTVNAAHASGNAIDILVPSAFLNWVANNDYPHFTAGGFESEPVQEPTSTQPFREQDTEYNNSETLDVVTLQNGNWSHVFENLPTAELKTINGKQVQCYYDYYIEEVGSVSGYETIYTDGSGKIISASDVQDHAVHVDGTQTVINRKELEIPVQKYWPDYSGDQYTWTATFQLQYREVKVDSSAANAQDAQTTWKDITGKTITVSKANEDNENWPSFTGLSMYRLHSNGTLYRLIYSLRETSFKVTSKADGSTVLEWNGGPGAAYTPQFDQDAGENGSTLDDYEIVVINTLSTLEATEEINVGIQKEWPQGVQGVSAEFELRRYVQTEYTDFSNAADLSKWVDITLNKGNGHAQTLHVPEGWQMTIVGSVKSGTNAGTVTFSDGTDSTAVTWAGYDNSNGTTPHEFAIHFVADRTKTITLTNGADYIVGGAGGLRLSDRNSDDVEDATEDEHFVERFTLNDEHGWQKEFHYLSAIEEDVHNEEATDITRHIYTYYFVENGSVPANYTAIYKASDDTLLGDEAHQINFGTEITAENHEKPGSLKITKVVEVDDTEASTLSGLKKTLADGTYTFKVYESDGTTEAVKNDGTAVGPVTITITGGAANTVEVTDLVPGTYIIKEISGSNASVALDTSSHTVTVVSDQTGNAVQTAGIASVTNNYTSTGITVRKLWQKADGTTDASKTGNITFTLIQTAYNYTEDGGNILLTDEVAGSETAFNGPYTLQIGDSTAEDKTNASSITFDSTKVVTITNLPEFGVVNNVPVKYVYSVRENYVDGYTGMETQDGEGNWTITNRPSAPTDEKTTLTVTKEWKDAAGQPAVLAGDENIQYTVKERKVATEYAPVTISLYDPYSSTAVIQKTVYVKKGTRFNYRMDVETLLGTPHYVNISVNGGASVRTRGNTINGYINVTGDSSISAAIQSYGLSVVDNWADDPWTRPAEMPLYTWYFDYSGTADLKENYTDLVALYQNTTEGTNVSETNYVYDMTADQSTPVTDSVGEVTTANFVASFANLPLFRKVGNDYCVYYYTIDEIKVNGELVVNGETSDYIVAVNGGTITNRQKPGALKIVKEVTVNGIPATSANTEADGTYTFKVFKADGTTPAVDKDGTTITDQTIEIKNGVIYKVNGAEVDEEHRFALVGNLVPGDYVIREEAAANGAVLRAISGGKNDGDITTREVTVTVTAGDSDAEQAAAAVTFTNNKVVDIDITILKMDVEGEEPLTGAKFRLDQYDEAYREVIKSWNETEVSAEPGKEGTLEFKGIGAGYYKLVETKSPDGYIKAFADPAFSVQTNAVTGKLEVSYTPDNDMVTYDPETKVFTVKNEPGAALPNAGGPGTRRFVLIGTALILLAAGIALLRRRRFSDTVAIRAADSRIKKNGKGGGGLL